MGVRGRERRAALNLTLFRHRLPFRRAVSCDVYRAHKGSRPDLRPTGQQEEKKGKPARARARARGVKDENPLSRLTYPGRVFCNVDAVVAVRLGQHNGTQRNDNTLSSFGDAEHVYLRVFCLFCRGMNGKITR